MKLSVKSIAIASGIIWGIVILLVGITNLAAPSYGNAFLDLLSSIYPGYQPGTGFYGVVICTLYGLVDAAIGGAVFAWLYNQFSG